MGTKSRITLLSLNDPDVPGFKTNTEFIVLGITNFDEAQIRQPLENIAFCKCRGEVTETQAFLPHVKITQSVIGITWRRQ